MGWKDAPLVESEVATPRTNSRRVVAAGSMAEAPEYGFPSQAIQPVPGSRSPGEIRAEVPLGIVGRGIEAISPGTGTAIEKMAKQAFLPTALTALAPELGAARGIGMLGKMALESLGNVAGEAINQQAGITPPSQASLGLAALTPPGARLATGLVGKTGQAMARNLPGAPMVMNELAAQEAAALPSRFVGPTTARSMFQQAAKGTGTIETPTIQSTVSDLLAQESKLSKGAQNSEVMSYLKGLEDKLTANQGKLNPVDLHDEMVRLGELRRAAERKGGPELGTYKKAFTAFSKDLESGAASNTDAKLIQQARQTAKREFALGDLEDWIQTATKLNRGQGENVQFNANYVLNQIKKDDLFAQSLGQREQKEIADTLSRLNKVPVLDAPSNVMVGSGKLLGKYGTAGAAGTAMGGPAGGAAGVAVAWLGPKVVAYAVGTPTGRTLLKNVLARNNGILDHRGAAILAAGAGGALQEGATP